MKPLTILVADDEEALRQLVKHWLVTAGHAVVLAADGNEARGAVKRQKFDLVITDVLMPGNDGLDLITHVKTAQPQTRILAISGGGRYMGGDDCLRMARGLGAHATVIKPFNWEQLQAGMTEALAPPKPEFGWL